MTLALILCYLAVIVYLSMELWTNPQKRIINLLLRKQVGETISDLGLDGQTQKKGTPTMGGLIILTAILLPTLLFAKLHNVYIVTMLIATVWLGIIGFIDDYIKVKANREH